MSSQAVEHQNATPVHYPGFDPQRPFKLPMQNGKDVDHRVAFMRALHGDADSLRHTGIRKEMHRLLMSTRMQHFFLDAFWWTFLEHFAAVDLDSMVDRAKKNALVNDVEIQTYMLVPHAPRARQPVAKQQDVPSPTPKSPRIKIRREDFDVPKHLAAVRSANRNISDIVSIGSPRSPSVDSLLSSLASVDAVSEGSWDDASSSVSSASTVGLRVENGMRIKNFRVSQPALDKLDDAARNSIVAREQHQLFTRMAENYSKTLQKLSKRHRSVKDAVTRQLPEILSQALYYCFVHVLPYATALLDNEFQTTIARRVHFWLGGVDRCSGAKGWGIHAVLRKEREKARTEKYGATDTPKPPTGLGEKRGTMRKASMWRHTNETTRSVLPDLSNLGDAKAARVVKDVELFRNELLRMRNTHTFSQFHYGAGAAVGPTTPGRTVGATATSANSTNPVPLPKRVANTFAIGPQKRTVQVIKAELDAKHREVNPWYAKQSDRIPLKDELSSAKFSLKNWSPLVHRFMLLNGTENRNNCEGMTWTL